jgi:hypothetical protein
MYNELAYFGACLALFSSGQGSAMLLAAGIPDVIFAVLFGCVVGLRRLGKLAVG